MALGGLLHQEDTGALIGGGHGGHGAGAAKAHDHHVVPAIPGNGVGVCIGLGNGLAGEGSMGVLAEGLGEERPPGCNRSAGDAQSRGKRQQGISFSCFSSSFTGVSVGPSYFYLYKMLEI